MAKSAASRLYKTWSLRGGFVLYAIALPIALRPWKRTKKARRCCAIDFLHFLGGLDVIKLSLADAQACSLCIMSER